MIVSALNATGTSRERQVHPEKAMSNGPFLDWLESLERITDLEAEVDRLKAERIGTLYERYDRLVADHEALIAENERLQGLLSRAQGGRSE